MAVVSVIIPAFNEEKSIAKVVKDIPRNIVRDIVVVNNNSTDQTEEKALKAGAIVLNEQKPGYGNACLNGIRYLSGQINKPDVVVFLDGDYSDFPEEMNLLVDPIVKDNYDFVLGSRRMGKHEKDSLTPQQIFGNWLATKLIWLFYKVRFTDLGPFRAIRYNELITLGMVDRNYGWTVEMQIKAVKKNLKILEVPVNYRKRIGKSKVSGTIKGTILAGIKIIYTIFKYIKN